MNIGEMEEDVNRLYMEYKQALHAEVEAEKKLAELRGYSKETWLKFYTAANVLAKEQFEHVKGGR